MLPYLGISLGALIWCALILFAAAFVRGYSGFGFSSVLMAGLTFVMPAAEIVPLSIGLEVVASVGQARGVLVHIDRQKLIILLAAGLVGTPVGVYSLVVLPDEPLRVAILAFILVASLVLLISPIRLIRISPAALVLAGLTAGVVNGATALSGLVLALFFAVSGMSPQVMRATMIAYFLITDLWTGGVLGLSGFIDQVTVLRWLAALPVMALGIWTGSSQFAATPPGSFRTMILCLLVLLSVIGLIRVAWT